MRRYSPFVGHVAVLPVALPIAFGPDIDSVHQRRPHDFTCRRVVQRVLGRQLTQRTSGGRRVILHPHSAAQALRTQIRNGNLHSAVYSNA